MYVKMYANMYMYTYIYVHINMYTNTYINMYMNMNTTAAILAQAQSSRPRKAPPGEASWRPCPAPESASGRRPSSESRFSVRRTNASSGT